MKNKIYSVLIALALMPFIVAFVLGLTILGQLACHLITINFSIWALIGLLGGTLFAITTFVVYEFLQSPKPFPAKFAISVPTRNNTMKSAMALKDLLDQQSKN